MLFLPCSVRPLRFQYLRLSLLLLAIAFLFPSEMALAQVTYTGTTPSVNFGSQAIGSTSAAQSLSFNVSAGTTVGSVAVLTLGSPNLDFANAAGTTCTATTYSSATTCMVNVTFKPVAAGSRGGAVVFFSGTNNTGTQMATVPIYGIGSGPQIAYGPGMAIAIDPTVDGVNLYRPGAVAVDGAGDVFIADTFNRRVVEVPAGGGAAFAIDSTVDGVSLGDADGLALDGAGNLFIVDIMFSGRVVEVPAGGGTPTTIAPATSGAVFLANGVAVDGASDLFFPQAWAVIEVPASGGKPIIIDPVVNGAGLIGAIGAAVDVSGDLFIVDCDNPRVVEVPAGGGAPTAIDPTVDGIGLNYPGAVAVDGAGNLFISDGGNNRVVEVPAGGGAPTAIDPTVGGEGLNHPFGVAVDGAGDLFIADQGNNRVVEIERSQPPPLIFPTVTPAGTTDITDGQQTVNILNIGNQPLIFTTPESGGNPAYPADFPESLKDSNLCTAGTTLGPGVSCDVSMNFMPASIGKNSGTVVLTDNSLNQTNVSQSISLTGTGSAGPAVLTSPTPGSNLTGASVTFSWTAGVGVTNYWFNLGTGTSATAAKNVYSGNSTTTTLVTVSGLPTNGEAIYATLYTYIGGAWQPIVYTYYAVGPSVLTAPSPGSNLTGSATFTWSHGTGITTYWLDLGTAVSGADIKNIYNSGPIAVLSKTVTGIPQYGQTLYATLYSLISGVWQPTVYTYNASGTPVAAVLSTPTPGSKLASTSATFAWSPGGGVTKYWFNLGTEHGGYDSKNIYSGSPTTATSVTVGNLPFKPLGETIYATLYSYIAGAWQPTVYSYTSYGPQTAATLTAPIPGSTLTGSSQTFSWTPGTNVEYYWFNLGTAASGADAKNIDSVGVNGATSVTLTGLPTNGETIYATLYSYIEGAWQGTVYSYTAQ